ncbi:1-aminocyclopropane-1-carboxylate oxidase [Spatholobus suberectus]|nr:1-aminocyclopropane-1-carboxylate oxidase [Spatholobus suberectus]
MDFRAPPPSPVASARRLSLPNDDVFRQFLDTSLRLPNINNLQHKPPPTVDFRTLWSDDGIRRVVSDSLATVGCFQLLNHGIPLDLIASPAEAAIGIFRVPPEKRAAATRSPENPYGFEEQNGEENELTQLSEEFVWGRDNDFDLKMERLWPTGYSNFSKKMDTLLSRIEKVAEKILPVIFEDSPKKFAPVDMIRGHERGTLCCVYKHNPDNMQGQCANSLKYDVIRMLIRGNDYSHSLCLHVCDGSSEFQVYSKKGWLSFFPEKGALVITCGDQTQILTDGHYKHVIGRPMFKVRKRTTFQWLSSILCQTTRTIFKPIRKALFPWVCKPYWLSF